MSAKIIHRKVTPVKKPDCPRVFLLWLVLTNSHVFHCQPGSSW